MDRLREIFGVQQLSLAISLLIHLHASVLSAATIDGAMRWGDDVIIKGSGFNPATDVVKFNGVPGTIKRGSSNSLLQVILPDKAVPGPITVTDSTGKTFISSNQYFFTTTTINEVIPLTGSVGTMVFIKGKNFDPVESNNIISFSGTDSTVERGNETLLIATVPKGAKTGPISWKHKSNQASFTFPASFSISDPSTITEPTIAGFNPDHGPTGLVIEVKGSNFGKSKKEIDVLFNGNRKASVLNVTSTSLYVEVPDQATTGPISVITRNGKSSSTTAFTVTGPTLVFTPTSGSSGSHVTISGAKFDTSGNIVTFNGIKSEVVAESSERIVVKVPSLAQAGSITVTNSRGSLVSNSHFELGPQRALHLYGGGTVNFFAKSSDGTTAEPQPLFGLIGVHRLPAPVLFDLKEEGDFLFGGELSYRGVAAESADLKGLAAANSVGLFVNAYYSVAKGDTFTVGPSGMIGYEFLTGDNFRHDAQYSNGVYARVQDHDNPLYYGQVGYGNTAYLKPNRLLLELSAPLMSTLLPRTGNPTSFYSKDFTDVYFFVSANLSTSHHKDDIFLFGVKGVISPTRFVNILNPNRILVEKALSDSTAKPTAP